MIEISEEEVHFRLDRSIYLSIVLAAVLVAVPAAYAAPPQSPAEVTATAAVNNDASDLAGATVVPGAAAAKESDVLSDKSDELASELLELVGPAVGPDGAQIIPVGQDLPSYWNMNIDNDAPDNSR